MTQVLDPPSFKDLGEFQRRLRAWQLEVFPPRATVEVEIEDMRQGVIEEVGELARVCLKRRQRIRGMADNRAFRQARDKELGDVLVYFTQLCSLAVPERPVRWNGDVQVSGGPPSWHLAQVVALALEEFPTLRFSRVIGHLAATVGLRPEEVLEIFLRRGEEVMARDTARTRPLPGVSA